jgi:hypothetical protein
MLYLRILFLLFPIWLSAQHKYPVTDIPAELLQHANIVIRNSEQVYTVKNIREAKYSIKKAITILDEKGDYAAQDVYWEDKFCKMKRFEARIYDASGQLVRESNKSDFIRTDAQKEYEFTDNHVTALKMPFSSYPYTVEFEAEVGYSGFFGIAEFEIQRLGESVQEASYQLIVPENYNFKWAGTNTDAVLKKTVEGKTVINTWGVHHLKAPVKEAFVPYFNQVYAAVHFAPERIHLDGYEGDFSNWKQLGQYFYHLNAGRDVLSPAKQEQVRQMIAGAKNEREKIRILYQYLQKNYRYISLQLGIGGWQTLEASFVEQKKYGDCKALTNYMKALLAVAGIKSHEVDIYAGEEGCPPIQADLAMPRFNHVILYVPDQEMWLECTSNNAPAGYLSDFTCDRPGLMLTPEGGKLVRTPAYAQEDNHQGSLTTFKLDETGAATIRGTARVRGLLHDYSRHLADEKDERERKNKFVHIQSYGVSELQTLEINPDPAAPQTAISFILKTTPNYASRSGRRLFVPLLKADPFQRSLPADTARVHPLQIPLAYSQSDTFVYAYPPGYEAENLPKSKNLTSPYGSYELVIEPLDVGQLRVIRKLVMPAVSVPASQYQEVRQFFIEATKLDNCQAVLIRRG